MRKVEKSQENIWRSGEGRTRWAVITSWWKSLASVASVRCFGFWNVWCQILIKSFRHSNILLLALGWHTHTVGKRMISRRKDEITGSNGPQYIFFHIWNMSYLEKKKNLIEYYSIWTQWGKKGTRKVSRKYKYNKNLSIFPQAYFMVYYAWYTNSTNISEIFWSVVWLAHRKF